MKHENIKVKKKMIYILISYINTRHTYKHVGVGVCL